MENRGGEKRGSLKEEKVRRKNRVKKKRKIFLEGRRASPSLNSHV